VTPPNLYAFSLITMWLEIDEATGTTVGLDGVAVRGVHEMGDLLDLEVEVIARARCCPACGRAWLQVEDRPVVRVRDLPLAGRPTFSRWRKRRFGCQVCQRSFTETHPELPARQRVTARFRRWLLERVMGGAAHAEVAREEHTTRYQVARAFGRPRCSAGRRAPTGRRDGCRSTRPTTAAVASWRRSFPISIAAAWSSIGRPPTHVSLRFGAGARLRYAHLIGTGRGFFADVQLAPCVRNAQEIERDGAERSPAHPLLGDRRRGPPRLSRRRARRSASHVSPSSLDDADRLWRRWERT